jgi:hypothetical protein
MQGATAQRLDVFQRLVAEIGVVEFGVMAGLRHELFVAALFDNPPLSQDDNSVGRAHGGEAVGNDDGVNDPP